MTGRGASSGIANPRGSAAGRAPEAGSLHRSGVAAYLAAYGLTSRSIVEAGYAPTGPAPVSLVFETTDAVDDIRCALSDGSHLLIQAKRACGNDGHFRATVGQWTQYAQARPDVDDRVALAVAEAKGPVRDLGAALQRRRRPEPGGATSDEQKSLAALDQAFPSDTVQSIKDRVMDMAVVLVIAASTRSDAHFNSAANLLEGLVVPLGSGVAAIEALQRAFQEQAAAGSGSDVRGWLNILADANITVFADENGPAGPRLRAQQQALAMYRQRLGQRLNIIEYYLLADDVPPLTVHDLATSFVETPISDGKPPSSAVE